MTATAVFRDATQDTTFTRDGLLVTPMLDEHEIAHLRATYDRYPEQHATPVAATILSCDLRYRRNAHRIAAEIFAPKVSALFHGYRIFVAGFITKQPNAAGAMPMHQDSSMIGESRRPPLTIWCPLVDVDTDNGNLQTVFGSHELNVHPRGPGTRFAYPELEPVLRQHYLTPLPMSAGQSLFLHHSIFHCSPANASANERPVAVAVIAPDEAPLAYYHRVQGKPPMLEEYVVDEEFYLRHILGSRPPDGRVLRLHPEQITPIPAERFAAPAA